MHHRNLIDRFFAAQQAFDGARARAACLGALEAVRARADAWVEDYLARQERKKNERAVRNSVGSGSVPVTEDAQETS